MKKIRVGIIGCGTIGAQIAGALEGKLKSAMELSAICDTDARKTAELVKALGKDVPVLDAKAIIAGVDLVVEAACAKISGPVLKDCVKAGRDCMIMSVGGLLGSEDLLEEARLRGVRVLIPSGALCGIDGLKSASAGRVDSVTLTTRKPPKGLAGAPYLAEKGIDVWSIKEPTVVFDGSALEAVKGFPQNVNVSAVLSLAGLGAGRTRVKIVADPSGSANIHEVEITGESGRVFTRTENVPSAANPKTSAMAVYSAIATLEEFSSSVRIGT